MRSIELSLGNCDIVITDSASPDPPPPILDRAQKLVLPNNPGRSESHAGRSCGWTLGFFNSADWAFQSGASHILYVEQDCLLLGSWKELVAKYTRPVVGAANGTPQPLQQSLVFLSRRHYLRMRYRYLLIPVADSELSPEWKFWLALSRLPSSFLGPVSKALVRISIRRVPRGIVSVLARTIPVCRRWPMRGGRSRPKELGKTPTYVQHLTPGELESIRNMVHAV